MPFWWGIASCMGESTHEKMGISTQLRNGYFYGIRKRCFLQSRANKLRRGSFKKRGATFFPRIAPIFLWKRQWKEWSNTF